MNIMVALVKIDGGDVEHAAAGNRLGRRVAPIMIFFSYSESSPPSSHKSVPGFVLLHRKFVTPPRRKSPPVAKLHNLVRILKGITETLSLWIAIPEMMTRTEPSRRDGSGYLDWQGEEKMSPWPSMKLGEESLEKMEKARKPWLWNKI